MSEPAIFNDAAKRHSRIYIFSSSPPHRVPVTAKHFRARENVPWGHISPRKKMFFTVEARPWRVRKTFSCGRKCVFFLFCCNFWWIFALICCNSHSNTMWPLNDLLWPSNDLGWPWDHQNIVECDFSNHNGVLILFCIFISSDFMSKWVFYGFWCILNALKLGFWNHFGHNMKSFWDK